jgi:hypothetical protein
VLTYGQIKKTSSTRAPAAGASRVTQALSVRIALLIPECRFVPHPKLEVFQLNKLQRVASPERRDLKSSLTNRHFSKTSAAVGAPQYDGNCNF